MHIFCVLLGPLVPLETSFIPGPLVIGSWEAASLHPGVPANFKMTINVGGNPAMD